MEINGKIALVTGAGGDLGGAVVQALLDAGAAQVIALDLSPERLAALKDKRITTIQCDVSNFDAVDAALQGISSIDILINNAGILHSAPLVNLLDKDTGALKKAAESFQRVIATNLSSVFYVSQLVAKRMLSSRTKGVIVNVSSVSAQGNAGQSAYSASKAGVNALTMVWAKELAGLGVRTVAVAPGYIDTPSTRKAVTEAQLAEISQRIPMKKTGAPASFVQAILFAITNDYMNGTVLEVDGGLVV